MLLYQKVELVSRQQKSVNGELVFVSVELSFDGNTIIVDKCHYPVISYTDHEDLKRELVTTLVLDAISHKLKGYTDDMSIGGYHLLRELLGSDENVSLAMQQELEVHFALDNGASIGDVEKITSRHSKAWV